MKQITYEDMEHFADVFNAEPKNLLALNAVAKNGIGAVALNREVVNQINHTYSQWIDTPEATDQEKTGRCWLFAGLNSFRLAAMKKMNLKKFELSQAYLMFWDKLEKANFFLENIIETRNELLGSRLVMWLLADPLPDAGQWDMFVNLVKKYGVTPKSMMPETNSSSESRPMNMLLVAKLREYAQTLREMHEQGASVQAMRLKKSAMVEEFYRMLSIHLGTPPSSFFWEWRDKDGEFHRHGDVTPAEFFEEYVEIDLDDMVCLINAPTKDKPYGKLYTVQHLGNVVGGQIIRYLNVDIETLKKATLDTIVDGQAVWFGCDVGKMLERDLGVLDPNVYNYELVYGTRFKLDKAGRLDYGHSQMTHAMLLTGVDLDDSGKPIKWRVENSWGTEHGDKGYLTMADGWFDEFLYEVIVSKKYLSPKLLAVLDTEPVVLPPWDPMGALARLNC
jgi:bleomycin hydrolase